MSLINTTDSSGAPNVPDATKTVAWKDYIWIRRLGTSGEARFYIWNEEASSDSTYLKWQEKSDVALSDLSVPNTQVIVGNSSGKAAAVAMSGNATITNAGVVTVGSVASGAITNAMVNNSAAIAYSKLNLTGAILNADLAGSIAEGKLAGSIPYSKLSIADGSIPFAKINGANITNANMADMPANTVKVRDANSTGAASDKVVGDTQLLIGDGTGFTAAALSGDVTMANTGAVTIGGGKIHGSMLATDTADTTSIELSSNTLSIKAAGVEVSHIKAHSSAGVLGYGSSGAAAAITADANSTGKVLKSNGNNAAPTFENETTQSPMLETSHRDGTTGSHWLVTSGVTKIKVCLQGGGASGATDNDSQAGAGGGAGAYTESEHTVSAGQVYQITIGHGGLAGTPNATGTGIKSDGGHTEFRRLTGTTGSTLNSIKLAEALGGVSATGSASHIGGVGGVAGTGGVYTKSVNGQAGGDREEAFYGESAQGSNSLGGYGGSSYKGAGALGSIGGSNTQTTAKGYGSGGAGKRSRVADNGPIAGAGGYGAIYNIS